MYSSVLDDVHPVWPIYGPLDRMKADGLNYWIAQRLFWWLVKVITRTTLGPWSKGSNVQVQKKIKAQSYSGTRAMKPWSLPHQPPAASPDSLSFWWGPKLQSEIAFVPEVDLAASERFHSCVAKNDLTHLFPSSQRQNTQPLRPPRGA